MLTHLHLEKMPSQNNNRQARRKERGDERGNMSKSSRTETALEYRPVSRAYLTRVLLLCM